MDDDTLKEALTELHNILGQSTYLEPREGDYAELDENDVVHIKRADGTPMMFMSLDVWRDILCGYDGKEVSNEEDSKE
jgi:hypothetical protein